MAQAERKNPGGGPDRRQNRTILGRTIFLMALFGVLAFIPLLWKLWQIQIVDYRFYQEKAISQQTRDMLVTAPRGTIYDTQGNILAVSTDVYNVVISPKDILAAEESKAKSGESKAAKGSELTDAERAAMAGEYREFVETWVHEIKTPMASARLLLANHPGELADALGDELFRLEEYVDQALYYARSGSVEQDYLVRELSLDGVVRAALRRQARPLIAAGFRVEAVDWTATVYTDPKWLEFILGQLISNAVKYRGEHPVLSFRCREEENAIYLTVSDNGVGIPAEDLPRIFEKGFTGQNGRRLSRRSTGLGLYLCRKLCRRLGLELSASSQPGAGTQMTVCIPRGQFHLVAR